MLGSQWLRSMAMTFACCTLLVGADEKTPVPAADAQKQAEKLIKDVFKADYARAKLPSDKSALAEKLLAQGIDTKDDATARFVLFREARDLAAEVGDMTTCFKAIDAMANGYAVDALAMKTEALTSAAKSAPVLYRRTVAEPALTLTHAAIAADNYDAATRLAAVALTAAGSGTNVSLTQRATLRVKEVEEVKAAFENVKAALVTLKDKPTDAEANAAVGKFLCLMKGEWEKGVPMLALGKDPELKRLAELELAKPADAKEKSVVGDGWWDLADRLSAGTAKSQLQRRSGYWYRQALTELTGLTKTKTEKRLAELDKMQPSAWQDKFPPGDYVVTYLKNAKLTLHVNTDGSFNHGASFPTRKGSVRYLDGKLVLACNECVDVFTFTGGKIIVTHYFPATTYPNGRVANIGETSPPK